MVFAQILAAVRAFLFDLTANVLFSRVITYSSSISVNFVTL